MTGEELRGLQVYKLKEKVTVTLRYLLEEEVMSYLFQTCVDAMDYL